LKPLLGGISPFLESQQGIIEQNQKLKEQVAKLSRKIENIEGRDHEILTLIHALAEQKKRRLASSFR